jgi:hypothetical protein
MLTIECSRILATPRVQVFHTAFSLSRNELLDQNATTREVANFLNRAFSGEPSEDTATPLSEILASITEQARDGGWSSLRLDLWAGGRTKPEGFYLTYEGTDAKGSKVEGAAFVQDPRNPDLSRPDLISDQRSSQGWLTK